MTDVLTPLRLEYLGGRKFKLHEMFSVITDVLGRIDIEADEPTDFNSIPWGLWNILPPTDYGEAAVVHDTLYYHGKVRGMPITRLQADQAHRELVVWAKAPKVKVWLYYRGLRIGGWVKWREYRKRDEEEQNGRDSDVSG